MAKDRRKGRKVRVEFRQNRVARRREADWTRKFQQDTDTTSDTRSSESIRAKGDLSRKRTIIVDDEGPSRDIALWTAGTVTAAHGAVCRVDDATGQTWDCTVRRVLRTLLISQRSPVTCGDRVMFAPAEEIPGSGRVGVIERVEPRATMLSRRERRGREHTIVANADQLLIVSSAAEPRPKPHLIDRYIVAALKGGLRPVICFNKADLDQEPEPRAERAAEVRNEQWREPQADEEYGADEYDEFATGLRLDDLIAEYEKLGYNCLRTSATTNHGIEALRGAMKGHITAIAGQSGVGKSSLINAMQPGLDLRVVEVSEGTEKGRHTTTYARLLRLDFGGYVVDTPGIRSFDLWDVQPGELEALFEEFIPYVPQCRFRDCTHRDEIGCAVAAAVESGAISERRYQSYVKMYAEV